MQTFFRNQLYPLIMMLPLLGCSHKQETPSESNPAQVQRKEATHVTNKPSKSSKTTEEQQEASPLITQQTLQNDLTKIPTQNEEQFYEELYKFCVKAQEFNARIILDRKPLLNELAKDFDKFVKEHLPKFEFKYKADYENPTHKDQVRMNDWRRFSQMMVDIKAICVEKNDKRIHAQTKTHL